MGTKISKFLTDTIPSYVYLPNELNPPVCYEAQENYNAKGEYIGCFDKQNEILKEEQKYAYWRKSGRLTELIAESRKMQYYQDNEPHLDHPSPKIDIPKSQELLFDGWSPTCNTYLRLVFSSLDTTDSGLVRKHMVKTFVDTLGGNGDAPQFQELFKKYDVKGINCIKINGFLKLLLYLDNTEDISPGRLQRKIEENAKMAQCLSNMNFTESFQLGLF